MKKIKLRRLTIVLYGVVLVFFIIFFIYMGIFENVSVYQTRETEAVQILEDIDYKVVQDETAPLGVTNEYTWTINDIAKDDSCLAFYLVHQCADVYIDGELVYRLEVGESNRIGKSTGSNWVFVPLYREDSGKEIRVVVTPLVENVIGRQVEFQHGSMLSIYQNRQKTDLPQLVLSVMCISLGIIIVLVHLFMYLTKQKYRWDMIFLGIFSVLLGIWRITDTRFSPIMFSENPMLMGYVTLSALFLCVTPILLFVKKRYFHEKTLWLDVVTLVSAIACGVVLLCQVTGIAEMRRLLVICHIIIVCSLLILICQLLLRIRRNRPKVNKSAVILILILVIGAGADLLRFYYNGNSSRVIFMIVAFLIYAIVMLGISIQKSMKQFLLDMDTGLYNRRRWETIMREDTFGGSQIGLVMLDLNNLKGINDTMGHAMGDKAIFAFANILRNTIPPNNVICRWGGDEFTVMVTDATEEKMEQILASVEAAINTYNQTQGDPPIYYAAGYALSSEFPYMDKMELLHKADERMYQNKQKWYREHPSENRNNKK